MKIKNHALQWSSKLGLVIALVLVTKTFGQTPEERFEDVVREELNLADFELQALAVPANNRQVNQVSVELDGEALILELHPSSVRADGFRVVTIDQLNRRIVSALPPETTYRGRVHGKPGSRIAASIINGGLRARIFVGDKQWAIQPANELDAEAGPMAHVVYRQEDIIPGDWSCGVDLMKPRKFIDKSSLTGAAFGGTCGNVAEIAYDADVEFYNLNGSSIPNTVADIESINNAMNLIYEAEVDITHVITEIEVWVSETDPYTSSNPFTLLDEFRAYWNTNHSPISANPIHRDVAHLMTGKILGSTIGLAWVGAICESQSSGFGYGLSESRFSGNFILRTQLTTHELGHNWNTGHCDGDSDCAVMCSIIGSCSGVRDEFGVQSTNDIISYRNSRSCLTSSTPPAVDCNNNCLEDAQEIADGTAFDCNANNILDECDLSNGSQDCNNNEVPDECEDCDGNGIADECDLSSVFSATSPTLTPFDISAHGVWTFAGAPVRLGDVTLMFEASAPVGNSQTWVNVDLNGNDLGDVFRNNADDCANPGNIEQIVVPLATFDAAVRSNDPIITMVPDVWFPGACPGNSWIKVTIQYDSTNALDQNGNGIIDSCECPADCATAGPDAIVNINDLLSVLANWGTNSTCDIAPPGGDGVININDLLFILANWGSCIP